jgi:hypothetical protein
VNLRPYLIVGAVFFAFLFGMLADYMMFDAERNRLSPHGRPPFAARLGKASLARRAFSPVA